MLVVDDDPGSSGLLRDIFQEGYDIVASRARCRRSRLFLRAPTTSCSATFSFLDMDGIEPAPPPPAREPSTAVTAVTAFGTYETAIKALAEGSTTSESPSPSR